MLRTTKVLPPDWGAMGEAAKLFTRSLLMGLDSSVRKDDFAEPSAEDIENMSYHEAVEYLRKRDVIKKIKYDELSDKMKFRAFTASRITDGKILEKLNAEMIANVNDGKGLKDFLTMTKTDILDKVGMGPNHGWYWETVYRTNVQTAYNVGRAMGFDEDKPLALELVIIDDARTSDICRQYAGKPFILPYDHPFWQTHWPPFHFNCRTTVRAIYDESELPEEWSNPQDIKNSNNGFGSFPLENDNWWNEFESQVRQAKALGVQGEIDVAKTMLIADFESYQQLLSEKGVTLSAEVVNIDKDVLKELNDVISDIGIPEIIGSIKVTAPITTSIASTNFKGELKLNAVYMTNKTKLIDELKIGVAKGYFPKNCNSPKSALYHELFGHGTERFLLQHDTRYADKITAWRKGYVAEDIVKEAIAEILKTNHTLSADILKRQICLFATEPYSETMAYGLEDVYINKNNAQILSKEIFRVTIRRIEDVLRRMKK